MGEKIIGNNNDETSNTKTGVEELNEINIESNISNNNLNHVISNFNDPGAWDNIDTKLRDLLVEKELIRENDIKFPNDENSRHFPTSHYKLKKKLSNGKKHDRKWLVYSKEFDKAYCFYCKLFDIKSSINKLGNEGTKYWRNIGAKLKSHEISIEHLNNMNSWFDLELGLLKNRTIDKDLQEQKNKEKEHWRQVLIIIIAVVKNLAKNNLAFRGTNEKIYQNSNGNFLSTIKMIAEFDPIMQEHVRRIKMVKFKIIIWDIIYKMKQMSLVLRCVDISTSQINIEEFFLDFLKVDDTSGKSLFNELIRAIENLELDINDIRGQAPRHTKKIIRYKSVSIVYTHCGCHNLNLVLCNITTSCPKAVSFFGVLQRIYSLFSSSPKRWQILQNNVYNLTVKSLSQTHPKIKSEARCLATYELENFEFLLGMIIWYDILFAVNEGSKKSNSKDMHIDIGMDQLKGLVSFFAKYRENEFTNALITTKEVANEMEIEPKFCEKRIIYIYDIDGIDLFYELNILKENSSPIEILH
ncbi:hypothetical protein UlMin_036607 [Ulmus minor]